MIRNRRRTISAEDNQIIEDITGKTQSNTNNPQLNTNQDIIIRIKKRNFWSEDKENKITNNTIKIPLSEYVTRLYLSNNYYDKTQINNFIESYGKKVIILNSKNDLPQEGDSQYGSSSYIYFVKHQHTAPSNNDRDIYDEYIWDASTENYERIGNTDIDLSEYLRTDDFYAFVDDEYTVTITRLQNDLDTLKSNKVNITDFNEIIDRIEAEVDTKITRNDVEPIVINKMIDIIEEINTALLE